MAVYPQLDAREVLFRERGAYVATNEILEASEAAMPIQNASEAVSHQEARSQTAKAETTLRE